jgi:hypothetical protein
MNTKEGMDMLIANNKQLIRNKERYELVIDAMLERGLDCVMALETVQSMEATIQLNESTIAYIANNR